MKEIPERKVGERVRIMATEEMVINGFANLRGRIAVIFPPGDKACGSVCLIHLDNGNHRLIRSTCLVGTDV